MGKVFVTQPIFVVGRRMLVIRFFIVRNGGQTIQRRFRTRVNYNIRVPEVRVIDEEGEQLGVMVTDEALKLAGEKGLDLVEVSPTARPPVCRIVDYGKFKYEKNKQERESKKKQHAFQIKEVKFRPKTEEHDYQFKKRHAEEFLSKHHKVKFTVIFRGRELDHRELGARILTRIKEELASIANVEKPAGFEGRLMTMIMSPLTTAPPGSGSKNSKGSKKPKGESKSKETKSAQKEEKSPASEDEILPKADTSSQSEDQSPDQSPEKEGENAKT